MTKQMKATLTFNLPEDQYEYEYTLNAARYKDALTDILAMMRKHDKHTSYNEVEAKVFYALYDEIVGIVEGIDL
jgi:hypothetical protein